MEAWLGERFFLWIRPYGLRHNFLALLAQELKFVLDILLDDESLAIYYFWLLFYI